MAVPFQSRRWQRDTWPGSYADSDVVVIHTSGRNVNMLCHCCLRWLQGLAARPAVAVAALGAGSRLLAAAIISVSDKPVCVASLDTLAVTAVRVSDAPSTLSAANVLTPAASAIRVMITAEQVWCKSCTKHGKSALATFDVSQYWKPVVMTHQC